MTDKKTKLEPYPIIKKNECKACERCIIGCKQNALEMSKDLNDIGYYYAKYKGKNCNGCGDCYYTCPEPLAIEVHIPKKKKNRKDNYGSEDNG
ncbi:4Fe-4S dicluster domain-containing protein [Methanobrevibacter filiformis]|uniref:2-oxoglutarate-acceptor oxidoreductase subunit OorD n=1 Tax=Methanobrevibacter filiformis TaxID=55758 RepID=A0A166BKE8_9EURY|nr:4Fe-4S dicluster domain-containing protein [Methanobrevibacter filiformis]KZX13482.1 2-oxoglutarate-acceptor oxidoreductase subunit OorD [Methanobrevibacter filiformis]